MQIDFVDMLSCPDQRMKRKQRYIARLDEVIITRDGESAIIQYKEPGIVTTHFQIGPNIVNISDEAILDYFNLTLRAMAICAAEFRRVAVEVPLGSPQIERLPEGHNCRARGGVLRCLIETDENDRLVVGIDDQELSLEEFGRMLTLNAGRGTRIEIVSAYELRRRPPLEAREPDSEDE